MAMVDEKDRGAAVLDFGGAVSATSESGAQADPWQALASGNGMLVSWEPADTSSQRATWGQVLAPSTAFATQLAHVVERAGLGAAARTGAQLFTVELPPGQVLQNLVPAVGGGFRGLVRAPGSTQIAGHAR